MTSGPFVGGGGGFTTTKIVRIDVLLARNVVHIDWELQVARGLSEGIHTARSW